MVISFRSSFKMAVQLILLAICIIFFGVPAIQKYQKEEVMVVETIKYTDGIPLPAITIRTVDVQRRSRIREKCFTRNKSVEDCIQANTQNLSAILKGVRYGYLDRKTHLLDRDFYTEDFTSSKRGRLYTIHVPIIIGTDDSKFQFFLVLFPRFVQIMVHDPNFFVYNYNPMGLPTLQTIFDVNKTFSHYYRLALIEMQEIDTSMDPCNTDTSYNFNSCVRIFVATEVPLFR